MKRIEGVDCLRGLLACGVMFYHYLSWTESPLYKLYGDVLQIFAVSFVEMFFVISGFSLYYVYRQRMASFNKMRSFFIRRFFRIAPLFYSLLVLVIVIKLIAPLFGVELNRPLNIYLLISNFTFLFGLVWPPDSLLVGGWSIGVEMMMYLIFPVLIVYGRSIYSTALLCLLSTISVYIYSNYYLDPAVHYSEQWGKFTFFVNHLHFFTSGCLIYYIFNKYQNLDISQSIFWLILVGLIGSVLALLAYSYGVGQDALIGNARYGLFVICGCIVLLFALFDIKNRFFRRLGELSYSIYLGHFFVYLVIDRIFENYLIVIGSAAVGTYIFAIIARKFIELPMIEFGKRFGSRNKLA